MKHLFTLLSLLLCTTLAFAQGTVSGSISDDEGAPLPGATIIEVGTNNGVSTDFDGNFTINLSSENASLLISYVGYASQTVPVDGRDNINISLSVANELDEIIVTGVAGGTSVKKMTVSVTKVSQEKLILI